MDTLETRIAAYLAHRMPSAADIEVSNLARIHGGSSQETFRFHAAWTLDGKQHEADYILRRAPEAGLVNADHDLEFIVYSALDESGLPIPKAHFLELDPAWLDRPFFIMDMMPGSPGHFFGSDDPYEGKSAEVGRDFWHQLGTLAKQDNRAPGLDKLRNASAKSRLWEAELDHWEAVLDAGEEMVEPIIRGAIRWLRAHPPAEPARPAIIHGDYRSGNFLFLPEGRISAILDWEMCHIGDPLEDIAWALDPMWTMERHFPLEDGLAVWAAASDLAVHREALDWWRLFTPVKACALWTSAEKSFEDGENREMIVALTAMRAGHFHRKQILDRMEQRGMFG